MAAVLALPDDIGTLPTIAVDSLALADFFFCFFMGKEPQMLSQECNERNGPKPTVLDLLCTMAQAIFLGGIALGSIFGFIFMQK
jgi:hypothetical protein